MYFLRMKLLMFYFYSKIINNNRRGNVLEEIHAFCPSSLNWLQPSSPISYSRRERRVYEPIQVTAKKRRAQSLESLMEGRNCLSSHCLLLIAFGKSLIEPTTI
jgi:hypothetical protein